MVLNIHFSPIFQLLHVVRGKIVEYFFYSRKLALLQTKGSEISNDSHHSFQRIGQKIWTYQTMCANRYQRRLCLEKQKETNLWTDRFLFQINGLICWSYAVDHQLENLDICRVEPPEIFSHLFLWSSKMNNKLLLLTLQKLLIQCGTEVSANFSVTASSRNHVLGLPAFFLTNQ